MQLPKRNLNELQRNDEIKKVVTTLFFYSLGPSVFSLFFFTFFF